jgi:hypothetical protein
LEIVNLSGISTVTRFPRTWRSYSGSCLDGSGGDGLPPDLLARITVGTGQAADWIPISEFYFFLRTTLRRRKELLLSANMWTEQEQLRKTLACRCD